MEDRKAAEVFPPGEFIREELEERGWTQIELAEILGRSLTLVNEIVSAKRGISPETAKGLADAFGTSAQFWLNLQTAYDLSRTRNDDNDNGVARRARLYSKAPIREMAKRNWIEPSGNVEVLEKRLLDFFEIRSIDEEPVFLPHAAKKSAAYTSERSVQLAWLFRAKQLAHAVSVHNTFSQARFGEAIERLRALRESADELRHVPRILADAGIRFLIVEPLPRTRIDGACFWLNKKSPVIVLSVRFDRIDAFWHTLMHELGHIKNEDGKNDFTLDTDLVGDNTQQENGRPDFEIEADRFAVETLIPQEDLENFIIRVSPLYSKARIRQFAARMNLHPGIVVGQLQHRQEISYSCNREMLAKVRSVITQSALTDGWGSVFPAVL